jgi:D-alanyl-lipoteichoic acid acyltransferase DltB (MBOAT superfamily)
VEFNSLLFLLFLLLVLLLAYGLRSFPTARKWFLVLASYVFYGAWNPPFVLLLMFSTLLDWKVARLMPSASPSRKRLLMATSLTGNLGLLGAFKYGDFLLRNFDRVLGLLGTHFPVTSLGIILPVGISFYTFQTLSYAIDVYRGEMKPWPRFVDFALFVSFFPQLVAGPIVRASVFLPQCIEPKTATRREIGWGMTLLLTGLFQKMFLADSVLAPVADRAFGWVDGGITTGTAWVGILAFAGQILSDFAGYSLCAIGVAMLFGFALPDNFRYPYAAQGFSDFWRRWHISLSTWLRDYLYIPLGGNRGTPRRIQINLMITMLLGGLWHGAAWRFVVWGGLHGLLLVSERQLRRLVSVTPVVPSALRGLGLAAVTFIAICFTWVPFRANSLPGAASYGLAMLGITPATKALSRGETVLTLLVVGAILIWHWWHRDSSWEERWQRMPSWCRAGVLAAMLFTILIWSGNERAFIYFQF